MASILGTWQDIVKEVKPKISEVSIYDLHMMRMKNPQIQMLDVREDDEARSLPMPPWYKPIRIARGVLERNIKTAIPDMNREVVVVCAAGMRSAKACETMQIMGYTKVHSLKEGIGALTKGFQVAKAGVKRGFLESVGNTPLIRLNKLSDETGCEILAKAEFMNPGGSVKDRPALHLIEDAERKGLIKPGCTITEATSGNTGIGLAHVCNAKGYKLICCMPRTMAKEKQDALKQLGAELVLTEPMPLRDPKTLKPNMMHYHNLAPKIAADARAQGKNYYCVNQWQNTANRMAHYLSTGPEIMQQTNGKIDAFCCATGTGGTIGGVSRYLKEVSPATKVVLLDCPGSALFNYRMHGLPNEDKVLAGEKWCSKPTMGEGSSPATEGIGNSIVTENMEGLQEYTDFALRVEDRDTIRMVHSLLHTEGIFVGGSAGLNVCGAVELAKKMGPGHTIVTVLCDSGFRYGTKLFNKKWLEEKGLLQHLPLEHQASCV